MIAFPSQDPVQRIADSLPLGDQLAEQSLALRREPVEALVALVFLAPRAGQKPLRLEPAQERVEGPLVDRESMLVERLAQRVSVALVLQLGQDRQDEAAAAQLEAQVFV